MDYLAEATSSDYDNLDPNMNTATHHDIDSWQVAVIPAGLTTRPNQQHQCAQRTSATGTGPFT